MEFLSFDLKLLCSNIELAFNNYNNAHSKLSKELLSEREKSQVLSKISQLVKDNDSEAIDILDSALDQYSFLEKELTVLEIVKLYLDEMDFEQAFNHLEKLDYDV